MRKPITIQDFLEDIVDSVDNIEEFLKNLDFESFKNDKKTLFADIQAFEVLGEATKKIPDGFRKKYPDVPWKKMAGMRDKLIHDYWGVNVERVWETATKDIPPLKKLLKDLV